MEEALSPMCAREMYTSDLYELGLLSVSDAKECAYVPTACSS